MIVPRFDTIFTVGVAISAARVALAAPAAQPGLDARDLAENEFFERRNIEEMAEDFGAFIERRDEADDDWRRRRRYGDFEADDGKKKKDFYGLEEGWQRGGNPRADDFVERRDDADDDWRRRRRYGQDE
ncbi:hypothetical protein LY78DRAFT_678436, partial [Colletotrichum sublineola]